MLDFLKSKRADVLSHWYTPVPNFNTSSLDFYAAVEKELQEQKVPGLEISRVEFSEGGILSDKRTYLRMTRERLVFDVCAAPFGINYFFSCRFAEPPAAVHIMHLVVLLGVLGFCGLISFFVFVKIFGLLAPFIWPLAWIAFLVLAIHILRNAVAIGLHDMDAALLKVPIINSVYEAWFRRETYYRQDTRLMYLTVVEGVVKKLVEQETAAKSVKLLTQYEYGPILGELYKPHSFPAREKPEPS